jgi:16S rRNA processing protein RimM
VKWVGIGTVTAAHGVHGEISVRVETDFPERFEESPTLDFRLPAPPSTASPEAAPPPRGSGQGPVSRPTKPPRRPSSPSGAPGEIRRLTVTGARLHKGSYLLKLAEITTRDAAEALRGAEVVIPRDQVKPLPDGRWYIFDLEGLDVVDEHGTPLGVLREVLQGAGNDVYVVQGEREILLPAIKQVILDVDLPNNRMRVHLMDGL